MKPHQHSRWWGFLFSPQERASYYVSAYGGHNGLFLDLVLRSSMISARGVFTLLAFMLAACQNTGSAGSSGGEVSARDSAGVRILEVSEGGGTALLDSVATELFRVGESPSDTTDQLHAVTAALWLGRDRRLLVADLRSRLRLYDEIGRFVRAIGSEGRGPGEFVQIDWIAPYRGDSVVVYDGALRRMTILDGSGRFSRTLELQPPVEGIRGPPKPAGVFSDGSFLIRWTRPPSPQEGLVIHREQLAVHMPGGEFVRTIADMAGQHIYFSRGSAGGLVFTTPPFAPQPTYVSTGDNVYLAPAETPEVTILNAAGATHGLVRMLQEPRDITEADIRAHFDRTLSDVPNPLRARMEQAQRPMLEGRRMPALVRFAADPNGRLWILPRMDENSCVWTVVDTHSERVLQLDLGGSCDLLQTAGDILVVRRRGAYGVEVVSVMRLEEVS
jgi:hypothetical protein